MATLEGGAYDDVQARSKMNVGIDVLPGGIKQPGTDYEKIIRPEHAKNAKGISSIAERSEDENAHRSG